MQKPDSEKQFDDNWDKFYELLDATWYFLSHFIYRRPLWALIGVILLTADILAWRDFRGPYWIWKLWVGIAVAVILVNMIRGAADEVGKPHVYATSFRKAWANVPRKDNFSEPRFIKARTMPGGDVEIVISATVPESTWQLPEVMDAFSGAFHVKKLRSVSRDRRNHIHLVLASGELKRPIATLEELSRDIAANYAIPIGVGYTGMQLWEWTKTPHILIAGATGSGKSTLVRYILAMLIRTGYPVYLVDPKNSLDFSFAVKYLATDVATNVEQAAPILDSLWAEHQRRTYLLREAGFASLIDAHKAEKLLDVKHMFLIVDELAVFQLSSSDKATKESGVRCMTQIQKLTLAARATGVSLILCTQYPKTDVVPSAIKQQCWKTCFRVDDSTGSEMILDVKGAETISPSTPGRAMSRDGAELREWQAYYFSTQEFEEFLKEFEEDEQID